MSLTVVELEEMLATVKRIESAMKDSTEIGSGIHRVIQTHLWVIESRIMLGLERIK